MSSESQDYERQVEALRAAGAEKLLAEKMSGARADRPATHQAHGVAQGG
jgi:DNA invertase Pin-like site-specific DNA recombinase